MEFLKTLTGADADAAKFLADVYPDWVDNPLIHWGRTEGQTLEIRLKSPCGRPDGDLILWFDGGEMTVQFTAWQDHFYLPPNSGDFAVEAVHLVRWLDAFLTDRKVIVNLYAGDTWEASKSLWIGHGATLSKHTRDEIGRFIFKRQRTTRYEVRSWSGGLDEDAAVTVGGWDS